MAKKIITEPSRTLSEYILLTGKTTAKSMPSEIELSTPLAGKLKLNIPFLSAAMQSVTGPEMAVALAKHGGLGVIYSSQTAEEEAQMVKEVKGHKAGFVDPETVSPEERISDILKRREKNGNRYSTFPITENGKPNGKLLGLITRNDYHPDKHYRHKVKSRMIPREKLLVGVNIENIKEANKILIESHHGVLPIVDRKDNLKYLVFKKDIEEHLKYPFELIDKKTKRYLVGAAINTYDYKERLPLLVKAGADAVFIDSSDGHSDFQKETIKFSKKQFPSLPVVGGNIITADGFNFLARAGADAVKVGMGSGSICITREQKAVGRAQATALIDVVEARDKYYKKTGKYIPVISDGGMVTASDMIVALAIGADVLMLGRYFSQFKESPFQIFEKRIKPGLSIALKPYWGEGSFKAQAWREKRYSQNIFEEGVEGYVPYMGQLKDNIPQLTSKITSAMSNAGCANIKEFHKKAVLEVLSELSLKEGRAHDIVTPSDIPKGYDDL